MDTQQAKVLLGKVEYVISKDADGAVTVSPMEPFRNTKTALREIAGANGIHIEDSWNTRYLGKRVISALNGKKTFDSQIDIETMLANSFLEEEKENELVRITLENVQKVEAMIAYDSKYAHSGNDSSAPDDKWFKEFNTEFNKGFSPMSDHSGYRGSSAFWMKRIADFYYGDPVYEKFRNVSSLEGYFEFLVYNAVCAVDAENSTHINSDSVGRSQLTERIVSHRDNLLELLKDTKDYPLIRLLSQSTNPSGRTYERKEGKEVKTVQYSSRNNFSFATKFCHYACMYIFEGKDESFRDAYSIYDNIVSNALKAHYGFKDIEPESIEGSGIKDWDYVPKYRNYQRKVDEVRNGIVSRNGFDHLMWYYYKGKGRNMSAV